MTNTRKIRAGLYEVTATVTGETFMVENRRSEFGARVEWLWFVTSNDRDLWLDPTYTKAGAIAAIEQVGK